MPFAVHLFFDTNAEAVIKSAWKKLADIGTAIVNTVLDIGLLSNRT
jgi:hypothetical protein